MNAVIYHCLLKCDYVNQKTVLFPHVCYPSLMKTEPTLPQNSEIYI